jgi:hypothetical protein
MEIDSFSFLLGALSIVGAYLVGAISGLFFRLWRDGQIK